MKKRNHSTRPFFAAIALVLDLSAPKSHDVMNQSFSGFQSVTVISYAGSSEGFEPSSCGHARMQSIQAKSLPEWAAKQKPEVGAPHPLAESVRKLKFELQFNLREIHDVIIVSDGQDTCGQDACQAFGELDKVATKRAKRVRLQILGSIKCDPKKFKSLEWHDASKKSPAEVVATASTAIGKPEKSEKLAKAEKLKKEKLAKEKAEKAKREKLAKLEKEKLAKQEKEKLAKNDLKEKPFDPLAPNESYPANEKNPDGTPKNPDGKPTGEPSAKPGGEPKNKESPSPNGSPFPGASPNPFASATPTPSGSPGPGAQVLAKKGEALGTGDITIADAPDSVHFEATMTEGDTEKTSSEGPEKREWKGSDPMNLPAGKWKISVLNYSGVFLPVEVKANDKKELKFYRDFNLPIAKVHLDGPPVAFRFDPVNKQNQDKPILAKGGDTLKVPPGNWTIQMTTPSWITGVPALPWLAEISGDSDISVVEEWANEVEWVKPDSKIDQMIVLGEEGSAKRILLPPHSPPVPLPKSLSWKVIPLRATRQ